MLTSLSIHRCGEGTVELYSFSGTKRNIMLHTIEGMLVLRWPPRILYAASCRQAAAKRYTKLLLPHKGLIARACKTARRLLRLKVHVHVILIDYIYVVQEYTAAVALRDSVPV